jgi:hypothetical protein
MGSITRALQAIKEHVADCLAPSFIEQICREVGHTWRDRILDPVTTIHLFILQILCGNTACTHLPRLTSREFTASAYCQARARLPLRVITTLVARIGMAWQETMTTTGRWHGHRIVLVDGSSFSMPDTPALQQHFGQSGVQKKGCGFPTAHLLASVDAHSGLILEMMASPLRTSDMACVSGIHPKLRPGDVLVGDRAFCSFAHLALLRERGLEACFRIHQKQIVSFRPHRRSMQDCAGQAHKGVPSSRWLASLGLHDQLVEWVKPRSRPVWMSAAHFDGLPASLVVRELRYRITAPGFRTHEITLATTLLDSVKYPARELAELYKMRWQVETCLRHIKTTMKMDVLHCQSVNGVMKELWMFVLVYNLVRLVMLEAARRQGVGLQRLSFIDAMRWLAHAPPDQPLPALIVNPHRSNRIEPRVVKRRPEGYSRLIKPRAQLRQNLRREQHAA